MNNLSDDNDVNTNFNYGVLVCQEIQHFKVKSEQIAQEIFEEIE